MTFTPQPDLPPYYKRVNAELELRELTGEDVDGYYAIIERNRAELARWEPGVARLDREDVVRFISPLDKQFRNVPLNLGIWYRGQLAGLMQFRHEFHAEPCIGYWLVQELWGRGIVTAAARALLDSVFLEWGWQRITIDTEEINLASRRIAEKLGFHLERIIPAEEWGRQEGPGQCVYAISAEEWRQPGAGREQSPAQSG